MSEDNNELKTEGFEEYFKVATEQIQELIENLEKTFETTKNEDAKKYAEELKEHIKEIKKTLDDEEFSPEKEEVFADYVEELIEKYSNYYLLILANEELKRLAEENPVVFDKMPTWENIYDENQLNEYNPLNNLENISDEELEQLTKDNPVVQDFYNYILSSIQDPNNKDDKKEDAKTNSENESEK